jgi:biotin carboxyl carrier protein
MDIRKIKKLIELVEESGISELEISEGEESVRISRAAPNAGFPVMQQAYAAPMMQQQPALSPQRLAATPAMEALRQRKSVVTSYVPQWLVLSTAPRARTRKRSSKSVRKSTWAIPCASLKR